MGSEPLERLKSPALPPVACRSCSTSSSASSPTGMEALAQGFPAEVEGDGGRTATDEGV